MDGSNQRLLTSISYKELLYHIASCFCEDIFIVTDVMREVLLYFNIDIRIDIVIKYIHDIFMTPYAESPPDSHEELIRCEHMYAFRYIQDMSTDDINKIKKIYPSILKLIEFYANVHDHNYTLYQLLNDLNIHPDISADNFYLLIGSVQIHKISVYSDLISFGYGGCLMINNHEKFREVFRDMYGNKYEDILENLPNEIPFTNPYSNEYI